MTKQKCPTCGSMVEVSSSDEGTSCFVPMDMALHDAEVRDRIIGQLNSLRAATLLDEAEQEITELKQQLEESNVYIEKLKNTIVNLGFDGVSILKELDHAD